MILQDPDLLLKIHQFDYDLNNPKFVKYFEGRTGIMISKMECGWDQTLEIFAIENQPAENHHKITKARLQDSWELFSGKE